MMGLRMRQGPQVLDMNMTMMGLWLALWHGGMQVSAPALTGIVRYCTHPWSLRKANSPE
jgi:hypothetical protein